ncbi:MAG: outer membrane beta-barrel protein [Spirochaetes bacterium]|nr:outer membrane beta-barrel protein [Spirochaetota bacterium]
MKKIIILIIAMMLITPLAVQAQMSASFQLAYNIHLSEYVTVTSPDIEESSGGIGFLLKGRYELNKQMALGFETGYLPWYSFSYETAAITTGYFTFPATKSESSAYSIPLMGQFMYMLSEGDFVPRLEGALGLQIVGATASTTVGSTTTEVSSSSAYLAFGFGGGFDYNLSENLFLDVALRLTIVLSSGSSTSMLTPAAGIGMKF